MPRISRDTDIYPITMRELDVLSVEDITPGMRRIVFGGAGLREHRRDGEDIPAIVSDGFDDDMRMIFPHPETGDRPYPVSLGDGRLNWTAEVNELFRTYTVRKWVPDAGTHGELTVDFARHGAGLAEGWSTTASVGDRIYAAGPKNCASLPVHTDWLLLVGDETALPAIGRCLEDVPAGHRVVAVVEVAERADIQHDLAEVACADTLDLQWVVRGEGGDFTEVVAAMDAGDRVLPDGTPFVWAGGEAGRLKSVRRFVKTAGVPREHVQITGYWRKSDPAKESAEQTDSAATSSMSPLLQLHELTETAPGFALQAAARLGIFEAVDTAAGTGQTGAAAVGAVAKAVDVEPSRLIRFLRYLESIGLLTLDTAGPEDISGDGDTVRLTTLGSELADPDGLAAQLTGPDALRSLTWLHLDEGLKTGHPVQVGATGRDWAVVRSKEPTIAHTLADTEATRAQWVAPALAAKLDELPGGAPSTVAVAGASEGVAAAVYADELLRGNDNLTAGVLEFAGGPGEERLLGEVGQARRDRVTVGDWGSAENAGLVILLDPFALTGANRVPALLREAAVQGGPDARVVIITRLLAESGDEDHDYEEDLTRMLVDGSSIPTRRELARAVAESGLDGVADIPVGWGSHAVVVSAS